VGNTQNALMLKQAEHRITVANYGPIAILCQYTVTFRSYTRLNIIILKSTVFWYVTPRSLVKFTAVQDERTASIFRVEQYAKQEKSNNAAESRVLRLRNVCGLLRDCTASQPRMPYSSKIILRPKRLWRRYIDIITEFLDIIHHPVFLFKTQCFGDWILSPSSGRRRTKSIDWLSLLKMETESGLWNAVCFK
jgi:hypothetical protein